MIFKKNRKLIKREGEEKYESETSGIIDPGQQSGSIEDCGYVGADAVYIGGEAFGLRAKAKNFSMEDMKKGVEFAHAHGVKVHVTVNILAHNDDLPGVEEYLKELKEVGPDALIIADPGVFELAKEICPEIQRHVKHAGE